MNTNHECKNKQLSDTLSVFFGKNVNLAHIKLISLFMTALCKAKTVCFSKLATCFDPPAKADSCLRRIQRFFAKHSICQDLVAKFIFHLLPQKEKYRLAIDRTNWQFGRTDINIFMLAVVHDGVTYSLLFSMLPKRGTSNTQERIDLVQRYVNLFGADTIDCLLADREFVGERWLNWLNDNSIRYFIRIRENFWALNPKSGKRVRVSWIFNHLKVGEADFFLVHRNLKPIRILPHGRKAKSIFRYGLDILTEFLVRGRNDHQLQFFDFLIINEIRLDRAG